MTTLLNQEQPAHAHTYEKQSRMKTTLEKMIAFHQDPKALSILTPPPIFVQLRRDNRVAFDEGELEFTLWFGPIPIRWVARHEQGPTVHSFADRMISGPMAYWRHEHIFQPQGDEVILIDRVTLAHKAGVSGLLTRLIFDGIPLRILFFYRHLRTRWIVEKKDQ